MVDVFEVATRFADLHRGSRALLLPNAWDVGSARLIAALGFEAVATTSGGFAASLGRPDYGVSADEALAHAAAIAAAIPGTPVSADLEDGFAHDPAGVADTIRRACECGLAGGSIEDATGDPADPIHGLGPATARVEAAAAAARGAGRPFTLTARAENALHGIDDLDDTVTRLQAYARAGADVLYAPGLVDLEAIRRVVASLEAPVNVLLVSGGPTVGELESVGVRRVSVGSALAFAAYGAMVRAAESWCAGDAPTWWADTGVARKLARRTFER